MPNENKVDVSYVNPPSLELPPGYSHVVDVRGGRLIFIAGQAALNAQCIVVGGKDIEAQADQCLLNRRASRIANPQACHSEFP